MTQPPGNSVLDEEFTRATSLRDAGDFQGAQRILKGLSQRYSDVIAIWLVLGGIQMEMGDYVAAEESFAIATTLRPRSELASLSLFHALKHLNRIDDAFAEMRRFLALRPESHEYELLRQELDSYANDGD